MSSRTYTRNWEDSDWYYTDTMREEDITKKCDCKNGKVWITCRANMAKYGPDTIPVTPHWATCGTCGGSGERHYIKTTVVNRKSRRKAGAPTGW